MTHQMAKKWQLCEQYTVKPLPIDHINHMKQHITITQGKGRGEKTQEEREGGEH